MAQLLKDPLEYIRVHSRAEQIWYASCVFEDIRKNHGDIKSWFYNNQHNLGPHFWERIQDEDGGDSKIVIDLSDDDDVEFVELGTSNLDILISEDMQIIDLTTEDEIIKEIIDLTTEDEINSNST